MQPACLDETAVLLFTSGQLDGSPRLQAESHIDGCGACRTLVALAAAQGNEPPGPASDPGGASIFTTGDRVGERYDVVRLIGEGGMGEVYEVVDSTLGDRVALKTIGCSTPFDVHSFDRLKAELQLARRVTHPNVCRVFDFGFHREAARSGQPSELWIPFLTMELLPGETLRKRIARLGRLPVSEALAIG